MKIALVAPLVSCIREPQVGGSQAFAADLARGLTGRGHEIHVYAATGSEIPGVTVIDTGVDPASVASTLYRAIGPAPPSDAAAGAFARVYSMVRQTRYDIVHNHAFDAPAIALARSLNVPVVHTLHLPPEPVIAAALRDAASDSRPPTVAGVSAFQAASWHRETRVDAVLPPYVPTGVIPWSPSGDGAVFAGRLSPEKGAAEAIDIAQAAGIAIDVYGDAYDPDYAREQIGPRRHRPGVAVHSSVPRTSLWAAMSRAAVVLCPARWDEPFGMAAAEAQACGTPVIAFNRGGLGEIIAAGRTGFLISPDDCPAAVRCVGRAADLSRSECRDHATRHLDLERSVDAHEQLYLSVVSADAGTAVNG
jgi:glycosyltransferase involved in cell wall biosynthesis